MAGSSDKRLNACGVVVMASAVFLLLLEIQGVSAAAAELVARQRTQDIAVLAASCVTCHSPSAAQGGIPSLKAPNAEYMLARLRAFKATDPTQSAADATIMPLLMQGYDDVQLEALAVWFSSRNGSR